jgi:hypothetical protein
MIEKNVKTDFSGKVSEPVIDPTAYVHPLAAVIGNVTLGKNVMVSPFAAVRGDEGQPLYIGDDANVQDGVVIHALETEMNGRRSRRTRSRWRGKSMRFTSGAASPWPTRSRSTGPRRSWRTPSWG